ncbi:hypothetical protein AB0G82_36005 [Streptomyces anulatus]|uniref:hypothetical protein n=1 Tax=Streptomyces anulatus TaxID=1892 RepID=UPI0033F15C09
MTTRRPLGTGPVSAVDTPETPPPGPPVPRSVLAAERMDGVAAVQPVLRRVGRRPLSTGPTTSE